MSKKRKPKARLKAAPPLEVVAAPAAPPPRRLRRVPPNTQRLIDAIIDLTLKHVDVVGDNNKRQRLRVILEEAGQAVAVGQSASVRLAAIPKNTPANGWPGGGSGGGATSSTEAIAVARLDSTRPMGRQDPVLRISLDIERALEALLADVERIITLIELMARTRSTDHVRDAPQCWVASELHGFPWDEQWRPFTITKFEGVLEDPWPVERQVCRWVYDRTRRLRRLPTHAEMQLYLERGQVAGGES